MTEVSGKTLELFRRIAERTGVAADSPFFDTSPSNCGSRNTQCWDWSNHADTATCP